MIRRLGFMEKYFITPSNHRVHHDRRVHKNFGGVFIIWDRIWGTFLDEDDDTRDALPPVNQDRIEERVRFGIT